jgi:hypothetical protein
MLSSEGEASGVARRFDICEEVGRKEGVVCIAKAILEVD